MDEPSVWQELDEYVVTKELDIHFRRFFGAYLDAIDNANLDLPAGKIERGGLVEVPMDMTLREVIFDIGGGILEGRLGVYRKLDPLPMVVDLAGRWDFRIGDDMA